MFAGWSDFRAHSSPMVGRGHSWIVRMLSDLVSNKIVRQVGEIKSYHNVSNCVFYPVSDVDWWNLVRFEDVVFPFDFIKLSHRVCQTNLRSPVWPTSSMA